MRKCFLMFALWVIVVMIAALVFEPHEKVNENVVVALELKKEPLK